jgi:hypothetical protein
VPLRYEGRNDLGCYERIRTGDNSMRHGFMIDGIARSKAMQPGC